MADVMNIKIAKAEDMPTLKGEWIETPMRTPMSKFERFKDTYERYKDAIPEGYAPISFTRFANRRW